MSSPEDPATPPDEGAEDRELDVVPADQDDSDDREAADPRPEGNGT